MKKLNWIVILITLLFSFVQSQEKRKWFEYGKTIVFGILKRRGKVYTEIVPNASRKTLLDIIRGRVDMETVIHSDGWRGYNGLDRKSTRLNSSH